MNKIIVSRFWSNVKKTETCWLWTGHTSLGYGILFYQYKNIRAHRVSYQIHKGKIPKGLVIDHLCRVKNCVNPDHLEAVTAAENTFRGNGISAINKRKTHCKNGHPFSVENTYYHKKGNNRHCIKCKKEYEEYVRKPRRLQRILSLKTNSK